MFVRTYMLFRPIVFITLILLSNSSYGVVTGSELYNWCKNDASETNNLLCIGYMLGAKDQQDMDMWMDRSFNYCLPRNLTHGDMQQVIINYLEDNPTMIDSLAAFQIVAYAFKDAFPCSRSDLEERYRVIDTLPD